MEKDKITNYIPTCEQRFLLKMLALLVVAGVSTPPLPKLVYLLGIKILLVNTGKRISKYAIK